MMSPELETTHSVLNVIRTVFLPLFAASLCGCHPWVFSVRADVDSGSGDLRKRLFILGLPAGGQVEESPFSREIRRLHIAVGGVRAWKPMNATLLIGRPIFYEYDGAIEDCNLLVQLLDVMNPPDTDRAATLQKALSNLQAGELDRTHELIYTLAESLRGGAGMPSIPEEQRRRMLNQRRIRLE